MSDLGDPTDQEAIRLLEGAYALETPADNLAYYRDFAGHYDASFADALGYVYPGAVAAALLAVLPKTMPSDNQQGRILDVGCGTGLVGEHLRKARPDLIIDGVDISPEMLQVAAQKNLYDRLIETDLTADIKAGLASDYAAIISAGTFTHGHLGPEPIAGLLDHCRAGACAIIGVNAHHHADCGFGPFMETLVAQEKIEALSYDEVMIYDGADPSHAGDTALLMRFFLT